MRKRIGLLSLSCLLPLFVACSGSKKATRPPCMNIAGSWSVHTVSDQSRCGGRSDEAGTDSAIITQDGCKASMLFAGSISFATVGEVSEDEVAYGGTFPQNGGTLTIGRTVVTFSTPTAGTAVSPWTLSDGRLSCSGVTELTYAKVTATRAEERSVADVAARTDTPEKPSDRPSLSQGCAHPALAPGLTTGSIRVGDRDRTYVLSVPAADPRLPRAIVFGFHGLGGSGAGLQSFVGELMEEAAAGHAIFVYPDGLAAAWGSQDNVENDVALFDALLAKISGEGCVDARRVFATGFSAGGYMSNILGCARGALLRGIAPLSGGGEFLAGACPSSQPVAAFIVHGTGDYAVETWKGEAARDHWRDVAGCKTTTRAVDPRPCVAHDGCNKPVVWCGFDGAHEVPAWAPAAVWAFFAALR
jgi:polyhydroxybutyrate depolymerase